MFQTPGQDLLPEDSPLPTVVLWANGTWQRDFADRLTRLTDSAISSGLGTVKKSEFLSYQTKTTNLMFLTFFSECQIPNRTTLSSESPDFPISKWSRLERTVRNSSRHLPANVSVSVHPLEHMSRRAFPLPAGMQCSAVLLRACVRGLQRLIKL